MADAPVLELKNVQIKFGDDLILDNVNMKINSGESVVLIGLSGGGKTVLLKTIAGLIPPAKGTVSCYGHDWEKLSSIGKHDLASKIGMQFQKAALFDELNTYENVAYPLREHLKLSEEEIKTRVLECLRAVNLEKAQNQQAHELSGGMKLRLGVARAIAARPEILFMDDPTAGLDPISADEMAELILNIKKQINATLIIVTSDIMRAYQFAGRIFIVADKAVLETGTVEQTKNHPDPRVQQFLHGWLKGPLTPL
jgi:phospholipid/cholesterol/gamma-HCH transport system ATP-binding protein